MIIMVDKVFDNLMHNLIVIQQYLMNSQERKIYYTIQDCIGNQDYNDL